MKRIRALVVKHHLWGFWAVLSLVHLWLGFSNWIYYTAIGAYLAASISYTIVRQVRRVRAVRERCARDVAEAEAAAARAIEEARAA